MAVSWSAVNERCTIDGDNGGAGYDCDDIVTAVGDTAYADNLLDDAGIKVYLFKCRFTINTASLWKDEQVLILHTWNNSTDAMTFGASTAVIEWGWLEDTDPTAPYTTTQGNATTSHAPVAYSFKSTNVSQTWCDGGAGTFRLYGGFLRFIDDAADFRNEDYSVMMPETTSMVQVNCEQFGGIKFSGTGFRIQECNFKGSENDGLKLSGTSTNKIWDVQLHKCDIGLDISGSSDNTIRRLQFRGCTADLKCVSFSGDLELIDSDTISTISGTASFSGGGYIRESNNYIPKCLQVDGETGQTGVRVFCYQKSSAGSTAYGSEQVTDSNGEVSNDYTLNRLQLDTTHTTIVGKLDYGNAAVRLRLFGKKFMDIEKVLGEKGITDTFIITDNAYLVETTKATVAAYTGISIDEGNQELDITEAHTLQEIYDYGQYIQAESGNMDISQLLKTKNGTGFTMPTAWEFTGLGYIDLGSQYVIGRYVDITINTVVNGARCAVVYNGSTISSGTASGTSISLCTPYTLSASIQVRARLAGYKPFTTTITISPTGNTVAANMVIDGEYT